MRSGHCRQFKLSSCSYGGGGYCCHKLLSPWLGMVSGCALLIDYVLTIAVSIASGADAIFSFLPGVARISSPCHCDYRDDATEYEECESVFNWFDFLTFSRHILILYSLLTHL
jgi:amino acid transporter